MIVKKDSQRSSRQVGAGMRGWVHKRWYPVLHSRRQPDGYGSRSKITTNKIHNGQAFSTYKEAVKSRLALYHFTRPLQLKRNPRQQTKWTNWLEYVSYEKEWLEEKTADAKLLEEQYRQALRRLLEALRCPSRDAMRSNSINATRGLAAVGPMRNRYYHSTKNVDMTRELEDFVRETEPYRRAQTIAYYQRHRVEWAVKEARLMETEQLMSSKSETVKRDTKVDTKEIKKRRRDDDHEEIPPASRPRLRDSSIRAVSDTISGKPLARRSERLTKSKDKVYL